MKAQYVATFGTCKTTHGIRDGWSYDRISEARTVCGRSGPFGVNHRGSGRDITVTCKNCERREGE